MNGSHPDPHIATFGMPLLLILLILTLVQAWPAAQPSAHAAGDALLDLLVFYAEPEKVERASLPPAVRASLDAYVSRLKRFKSGLPRPSSRSSEMRMVHSAHVGYERRLAAVSADPRAPALATAYVQELRPCYEWEGFHDCPKREAIFADEYIDSNPGPFTSYLTLLSAHRWLCTAEGYEYEKKPELARQARDAYAQRITRAVRSAEPMVRAAAEALAQRGGCFRKQ